MECVVNMPAISRWLEGSQSGHVYTRRPPYTNCKQCSTTHKQVCELPITREAREKMEVAKGKVKETLGAKAKDTLVTRAGSQASSTTHAKRKTVLEIAIPPPKRTKVDKMSEGEFRQVLLRLLDARLTEVVTELKGLTNTMRSSALSQMNAIHQIAVLMWTQQAPGGEGAAEMPVLESPPYVPTTTGIITDDEDDRGDGAGSDGDDDDDPQEVQIVDMQGIEEN